jgi:hypothetical protein
MDRWMFGFGGFVLMRLGGRRRGRAETHRATPGQHVEHLSSSVFDGAATAVSAVGHAAAVAMSVAIDATGSVAGAAGGEVIRFSGPLVARPTGLMVDGSTEVFSTALTLPFRLLTARRSTSAGGRPSPAGRPTGGDGTGIPDVAWIWPPDEHSDQVQVVPGADGRWEVHRYGAERAWSIHPTRAAALTRARQLARRARVELVVHDRDGKMTVTAPRP